MMTRVLAVVLVLVFSAIGYTQPMECPSDEYRSPEGVVYEPASEVADVYPDTSLYNARWHSSGVLMMGMHANVGNDLAERMAEELEQHGTRVILAFHRIPDNLLGELNQRGIMTLMQIAGARSPNVWPFEWWGSRGPSWVPHVVEWIREHGYSGLVISCRWGVDRTGVGTALALAMTGYYDGSDAWAAVVTSRPNDIAAVDRVAVARGLAPVSSSPYLGHARIGRWGAKAHNAAYLEYFERAMDYYIEHRCGEGC